MKTLNDWILLDRHEAAPPADARPERLRAGNPRQTVWNHYSDPSQQFHVGFWACEPGRWAIHYTEHEYCQLLEGEAVIHDGQGGRLPLKPGDQFVIPYRLCRGVGDPHPCRKLYVIFEPAAS